MFVGKLSPPRLSLEGVVFSVICCLVFSLVSVMFVSRESGLYAVVFVYILLALLLHTSQREIGSIVHLVFLGSCLFSFLVAAYWEGFYGSVYFQGQYSDDFQYDVLWSNGYYQSEGLSPLALMEHVNRIGGAAHDQHNSLGYVYVIVVLRWLCDTLFGGYSTFVPRIFNCFLLIQVALLGVRILKVSDSERFVTPRICQILFLAISCSPVLLATSVHVFRDILSGYLILLFYYTVAGLRFESRTVLLVVAILLFLFFVRAQAVFALILYFHLLVYLRLTRRKVGRQLLWGSFLLVVGGLIYSAEILDFAMVYRYYENYRELNIRRFGLLGDFVFGAQMPFGYFTRIMFFTFTPAPNFSSLYQIFISISAFLQILYFPALFFSLLNKRVEFELRLFFLLFFFIFLTFSGTFRHVTMFYPVAIVLVFLHLKGNIFSLKHVVPDLKSIFILPAFLFFSIVATLI